MTTYPEGHKRVRSGLDNLGTVHEWLEGRKLGLLTSPAGVDRTVRPTVDILFSQYHLSALFAPEHGIRGDQQAGAAVAASRDSRTGLPVFSLYGDRKAPDPEQLADIGTLVVDLQDVGSRYYTYLSTLAIVMKSCAEAGVPVIVLDRPNPLGGERVEGPVLDPKFRSFVGCSAMPARYGLTIGEFACWVNSEERIGCRLAVSRLTGWRRTMYFEETGLPWVSPSPNIPTVDSAVAYAGTCLFEGTNLSEGRGTTKPFELIGAPWLNTEYVLRHIDQTALEGVVLRPCWFRPAFSKFAGELCAGLQLHCLDRRLFCPYAASAALLEAIRSGHPEFRFLEPPAANEPFMIDLLSGSDDLRLRRGRPRVSPEDREGEEDPNRFAGAFAWQSHDYYLYKDC